MAAKQPYQSTAYSSQAYTKEEESNSNTTSSPASDSKASTLQIQVPQITLPKGGGALRGIDEKFRVNAANGTAEFSIPLPVSPGRNGFQPVLNLSYNSANGNSAFGLGWSIDLPSIQRRTDKQLPGYREGLEEDVFIFSGAEDLVPYLEEGEFNNAVDNYTVKRYRPRVEGGFARIEKISHHSHGVYWKVITKENIITLFGRREEYRIADPEDNNKIFKWLPEISYDNKGNWIIYKFKEDGNTDVAKRELIPQNLYEQNRRNGNALFINRYLKSVKYGNHRPYKPHDLGQLNSFDPQWPENEANFFELIFDYDDHNAGQPSTGESAEMNWSYRTDAFSDYRAGFEIRTTRLCKRVLMFHLFEELGPAPCLVRSLDFQYEPSSVNESNLAEVTYLRSVTQTSYIKNRDGNYSRKSLPPIEFCYQRVQWNHLVHQVREEDVANTPVGLMPPYQWTDLYGEGISGIFTEQGGEWFYKSNLGETDNQGNIKFASTKLVIPRPSFMGINSGVLQLQDLESNGEKQIVTHMPGVQGYFQQTATENWEPFRAFETVANVDIQNPNLRAIDLNGDGKPELLISEDQVWVWYASAGKKGYNAAEFANRIFDEEKGPAIVFADASQTIYLADMNGDGLTDLVRIRNGEICYWANKGYGRFSAKIAMSNAPLFDYPDLFNPEHLHLADVSGTGTADIIYTGKHACNAYLNLSGNAWSNTHLIETFPPAERRSQVEVVDLLGTGTPCLVWSSHLLKDANVPMQYIDLMDSHKPHIMIKYCNNFGKETSLEYKSATWFYLKDKKEGLPWITKLPFPVQVVQKITVEDKFTQTKFSTEYSYHHGYYDSFEREFRGFGRVEQIDVESYGTFEQGNINSPYITDNAKLYQPPIKTVTWFHTGVFIDRDRILSQFQKEYLAPFRGKRILPEYSLFSEKILEEPDLQGLDLSTQEWLEALRACKGMTLRQEVYELDVDNLDRNGQQQCIKLFNTSYHNCHIQCLQPKRENRYAVFLVTESEAITYSYELDLRSEDLKPDPRIAHMLNLTIDEYGNVLQSIAVVYQRVSRYNDPALPAKALPLINAVQCKNHLLYTENYFTNSVDELACYRLPLPCGVCTYELTGINSGSELYFALDDLKGFRLNASYQDSGIGIESIPYHQLPDNVSPQKRLTEEARTLYFDENLIDPLAFGRINHLAIPYENYKLALTNELLSVILYEKLNELRLSPGENYDAMLLRVLQEGGYHYWENMWWIGSGVAGFEPEAAEHFYLPARYTDSFGNITTLVYDPKDLFILQTIDPVTNETTVTQFDYRVLSPGEIKDQNDNYSQAVFDILGHAAATALKGKARGEGNWEADHLNEYTREFTNISLEDIISFFTGTYDERQAQNLLGNATTRTLCYFGEQREDTGLVTYAHHPACAAILQREKHGFQLREGETNYLQVAFAYSNGSGGILVTKMQAEPESDGSPVRWIASGKTVLNNKGKPVKQYEPYFSRPEVGHIFEEPLGAGVTPLIYYDAAGRIIRTEFPDGSYSRVEFTPWHTATYDPNDTLLEDDNIWYAQRIVLDIADAEKQAAQKTAVHANTPSLSFFDSLGREVITIAHNRYEDAEHVIRDAKYLTFTKMDAEGKPLWIQDDRDNFVMQYIFPYINEREPADHERGYAPCYDIAGNLLFQHSMDAGNRWMLPENTGQPMYTWDNKGNLIHTIFDELRRPKLQRLKNGVHENEMLIAYTQYGDEILIPVAEAKERNLRGQPFRSFDQAGTTTSIHVDFKGNLTEVRKRLTSAYNEDVNWNAALNLPHNSELEELLTADTFTQNTEYDALNRIIRQENWHTQSRPPSVYEPHYNRTGLLDSEWLTVRGLRQQAIKSIIYNAKGQKLRIRYGNDTATRYAYDEHTFRLKQVRTTRAGYEQRFPEYHANRQDIYVLQQLNYTYDPIGNITEIYDEAYETAFFRNQAVEPRSQYQYDALYRLIQANGRENDAATGAPGQVELPPFAGNFPNDSKALRNYTQYYIYDSAGNIIEMRHAAGPNGSWTRQYTYEPHSNQLTQTLTHNHENDSTDYVYDAHGNMLNLDSVLAEQYFNWDYRDMLHSLDLVGGGWLYYNYDSRKQRSRKRLNRGGNIVEERLYLGGMELYRRYENTILTEEVQTFHLFEDSNRVLIVEDAIVSRDERQLAIPLFRYQYNNHLGSATLELDENANIISYEEYHPYGTTAYQTGRSASEVNMKRYRYTGKERDTEIGLYYHGDRYFAPWIARWTRCDEIESLNLYEYSNNNPITYTDPTGKQGVPWYQRAYNATVNALGTAGSWAGDNLLVPTVQTIFGGSSANAPGPNDRTYSRQTYVEQAVHVAIMAAPPLRVLRAVSPFSRAVISGAGAGAVIEVTGQIAQDAQHGHLSSARDLGRAVHRGLETGSTSAALGVGASYIGRGTGIALRGIAGAARRQVARIADVARTAPHLGTQLAMASTGGGGGRSGGRTGRQPTTGSSSGTSGSGRSARPDPTSQEEAIRSLEAAFAEAQARGQLVLRPVDPARLNLPELMTGTGYVPVQSRVYQATIEQYARQMAPGGGWNWFREGVQPILVGDRGEIFSGHHRIIAARLANIVIPQGVIRPFQGVHLPRAMGKYSGSTRRKTINVIFDFYLAI